MLYVYEILVLSMCWELFYTHTFIKDSVNAYENISGRLRRSTTKFIMQYNIFFADYNQLLLVYLVLKEDDSDTHETEK